MTTRFSKYAILCRDERGWLLYCRQRKAKVESAKLNLIKKELDRLDEMINADVSVIRDKIEVTSREFLEAQYVMLLIIISAEEVVFSSACLC